MTNAPKRPILSLGKKPEPKSPAAPFLRALRRMAEDPKYALNKNALLRAAAQIEITERSMPAGYDILRSGAMRKALRVYQVVTGEKWQAPDLP